MIDSQKVAEVIVEVAAQEIEPYFRALDASEIFTKNEGEQVTLADQQAERALIRDLCALAPGSVAVGEESIAENPSLMAQVGTQERLWLIDPIDGTSNFAAGREPFAVMVAWLEAGQVLQSWIYEPRRRRMVWAERGGGVWSDGQRLRSRPVPRAEITGLLNADRHGTAELKAAVKAARAGGLRTGVAPRCAGHDYCGLARGDIQFLLYSKLMPWDHAPGSLIVREAGGVCRDLITQADYHPGTCPPLAALLSAADAQTFTWVRSALRDAGA